MMSYSFISKADWYTRAPDHMTSPLQGTHFEHKTVAHLIYTKRIKKKKKKSQWEKKNKNKLISIIAIKVSRICVARWYKTRHLVALALRGGAWDREDDTDPRSRLQQHLSRYITHTSACSVVADVLRDGSSVSKEPLLPQPMQILFTCV